MVDFSFIIINFNGLPYISELIESFANIVTEDQNQDVHFGIYEVNNFTSINNDNHKNNRDYAESYDKNWEAIIYDNNSTDGSIEYLNKISFNSENIKLIKSKINNGFCKGSNEAAKVASGKYLIFLNPDTKIKSLNLSLIKAYYEQKESLNKKVGVVGIKIINPDGSLQYSCRSFPTLARQFYESFFLHKIFKKSKVFGSYFMTWWDHNRDMEVDWLTGSFMFINRELFLENNGFDEDYFMYSEDTDLCFRLRKKGFKNFYFPKFEIIHFDSAIASRDMGAREAGIWKSRRLYFKKNYSEAHAKALSFIYFLGILNRILLFLIIYVFTFKPKFKEKFSNYIKAIKIYF